MLDTLAEVDLGVARYRKDDLAMEFQTFLDGKNETPGGGTTLFGFAIDLGESVSREKMGTWFAQQFFEFVHWLETGEYIRIGQDDQERVTAKANPDRSVLESWTPR